MSRSNKTEDPILPLAHNPILNSAAPGTEPLQKVVSSSSADKHTDDNDTDPPNESQTRQSQSGVEEKNDCFFKVIDISFDGTTSEVKGECYTESRLEEFYQTVPDQTEYTIRVILDGRSDNWWQLSDEMAAAYPLCRAPTHSLDRECPLYSSGILGPHGRWHLPTLRKMLDEDTKPRWYMAASSTYHGFLCQEKGNIDTTWKDSWMGYRYMRSEACWAFDHRRINENKIILICRAPTAHIIDRCSNASWRWLKTLDSALTYRRNFWRSLDSTQLKTLQTLVINILETTLTVNSECLDSVREAVLYWMRPLSKKDAIVYNVVERLGVNVPVLRDMENSFYGINEAIGCVSAQLHGDDSMVRDLQQDCAFYMTSVFRLKEEVIEAQEIHAKRVNAKQADSVNQLTLLAAFFLPLSLASGVLSMQTRFSDLNLLLYDFVGVVIILAAIAMSLAALSRWGPSMYSYILTWKGGLWVWHRFPHVQKVVKVCPLVLWALALLASFLIGMLQDVVFGLRILGYEAAGITGLLFLSLVGLRLAAFVLDP